MSTDTKTTIKVKCRPCRISKAATVTADMDIHSAFRCTECRGKMSPASSLDVKRHALLKTQLSWDQPQVRDGMYKASDGIEGLIFAVPSDPEIVAKVEQMRKVWSELSSMMVDKGYDWD